MTNRILTFIIGILTGAIITTSVFLMISKPINNNGVGNMPPNENGQIERPMGEQPEKPSGDMQIPPR